MVSQSSIKFLFPVNLDLVDSVVRVELVEQQK